MATLYFMDALSYLRLWGEAVGVRKNLMRALRKYYEYFNETGDDK